MVRFAGTLDCPETMLMGNGHGKLSALRGRMTRELPVTTLVRVASFDTVDVLHAPRLADGDAAKPDTLLMTLHRAQGLGLTTLLERSIPVIQAALAAYGLPTGKA